MHKRTMVGVAGALIGALGLAGVAAAQQAPAGKIVCWKDKAGKTLGCGDKVPPEYQDNATKELDRRGLTRSTTDSAEETARRRTQTEEAAQQKSEQDRRLSEQRRQDAALLNTFTSEKEIDVKRDRDLQVVDLQVSQLQGSLKSATDRVNDVKARIDLVEKSKKPVQDNVREELTRSLADQAKVQQSIAAKEKDKEEIRRRYAEYRKRFLELRGGEAPAATASAPVKK
jgi:hypothetical protein